VRVRGLEGKVIVVIGGTAGLGRSGVDACLEAGARVVAVGRSKETVDAVEALGEEAAGLLGDATDPSCAESAIEEALRRFGRLDGLYHVAGGSGRSAGDGPLHELTDEGIEFTLSLNLASVLYSNRAAARQFLKQEGGGSVLNMSSVLAFSPGPVHFSTHVYAAAKAGIALLVVQAAAEWGRYGVLVNGVAPDARTRMTEGVFYDTEVPDGWDEKDPANVSPLVVWLASAACDVTGRVFEASGGSLNVCDGWQHGPPSSVGERRFAVSEVADAVHTSIAGAPQPTPVFGAQG